jgi:O-acetyl-ADP-ribose deacetylase (regulator of RNase III)
VIILEEYKTYWEVQGNIRVNTVNCVGVMGKGIALEFKNKFPSMFEKYKEDCDKGLFYPGCVSEFEYPFTTIINVATKLHWRYNSTYPWIKDALKNLRKALSYRTNFDVVTVPALGCGNGGLDFSEVFPMIQEYLKGLRPRVVVFPPNSERKPNLHTNERLF